MIFQDAWKLILDGQKTQMRWPARTDEIADPCTAEYKGGWHNVERIWRQHRIDGAQVDVVYRINHALSDATYRAYRVRFDVGNLYTVQPGRGKTGVGYVRLMRIRYFARAADIGDLDARAEGYDSCDAFCDSYMRRCGKKGLSQPCWALTFKLAYSQLWYPPTVAWREGDTEDSVRERQMREAAEAMERALGSSIPKGASIHPLHPPKPTPPDRDS